MKAVLNPKTNEALGFDDNMSDDQIIQAIESDKNGRAMVDFNPTPYDTIIRPALEQAKLTGNHQVIYDAMPRYRKQMLADDPFQKSLLHGATFGIMPQESDPEKIALHGPEMVMGDLVGQTSAIIATMGFGELLGIGKAAGATGAVATKALPAGTEAVVVGSGKVLPKTLGETVAKTVSGVVGASLLGALYNGILESVQQGKKVFPNENGEVEQTAPDLVKIGHEILHGAVSWAPYGIGGTFVPKTAVGASTGTAAIAGTAYAVSKSEGHSETDARFNAIMMSIFHFTMTAGKIGKESPEMADLQPKDNIVRDSEGQPIEVNMTPEIRARIVEDVQNTIADYTKAKNGMTESNNLHQMVGDEYVKSEAQDLIQRKNEEFLQAKEAQEKSDTEYQAKAAEEARKQAKAQRTAEYLELDKLAGTFKDPYDPKMLDYLNRFIPAKVIVRLDAGERLRLANSPRRDLEGYKKNYDLAAAENPGEIKSKEPAVETTKGNLEADQIIEDFKSYNPIDEIVKSDTLTKALVKNVTEKVIKASQKPTNPDASAKGSGAEKAPATQEIGEAEAKTIVEGARGEFKAIDSQGEEPLVYFNTPGGGTVTVPLKGLSAETVTARIKEFEDAGGRKNPLTPEQKKALLRGEKVPDIPRETTGNQQPVEKSTKESGLSKSLETKAVKDGLVEDFGDLPSYEKRNMEDIAVKVSEFITENYDLAKKIALGEAPEQGDLRAQELFTGLRVKAEAEGDINTIRELALSDKAAAMATELGQRVKALDAGEAESAVSAIKEVKKAREEVAKKKRKTEDLAKDKKQVAEEIKKEIKKKAPKQEDWNDFLEALRC